MIELDGERRGELGPGTWFSDLYHAALLTEFTGAIMVRVERGDAALFFRKGKPVHAGGGGYADNYLGQVLVARGRVHTPQVTTALESQTAVEGTRPLLGALLVSEHGLDPEEVKRALRDQTTKRIAYLLSLREGPWQSASGENARIREIGVVTDGWPSFFEGLGSSPSDRELRTVSDALLGKSVRIKGGAHLPGHQPSDDERRMLHYLEKPRKPDHLERAMKNRRLVRGFLRALTIIGRLDVLSATEGVPIPKGSLVTAHLPPAPKPEPEPEPQVISRPRKPSIAPVREHPIVKEVVELHATLREKNLFEILGATPDTQPVELRKLYTQLAKKYHPDAFPQETPIAVQDKAREIAARLNEAYQTLTGEDARVEYMALLGDVRIKGDSRKAEKIREAEVKAKMGLVMLKKREYQKAREFFKFSMESDPDTGEYKAHFAWAMFADPSFDRAQAIEKAYPLVLEALRLEHKNATVHYYAGQILKSQERFDEALHHFRLTVALDRKHAEAAREVRLLDMRAQKKSDDKKSALSKLFKR